MLEALSAAAVKVVLPTPDGKRFLITADNSFATDLVSGKANTALVGVSKLSINGNSVMSNPSNGYLTFAYAPNYTPFRRGAKIDVMIYLSASDVFTNAVYPCLLGYAQPSGTLNYWSFGIIGADGARKIAFYGWNGTSNLFQSTQVITKKGWVKLTFELTNSLVLSVDGVEYFRKAISDAELQGFINNQNPSTTVPLTFYRINSTTVSSTKVSYISIE